MNMTKPEVRKALGLETDSQLADKLGVTRSAISQWPDDAPIPMPRQWQLKAMHPDIFGDQRHGQAKAA